MIIGENIDGEKINYKQRAKAILKTVGNLRLVGETGTGKTTLVEELTRENNWNLYTEVFSRDTSRWDLLATDTLEDGSTKVRKGVITQWLEDDSDNAKVLYLDGFNYCQADVKSLTESICDFRGKIRINELEKEYERDDNHYVIVSLNPNRYHGTNKENIAQKRRFESLRIKYLLPKEELKYLTKNYDVDYVNNINQKLKKLVNVAHEIRKMYMGRTNNGGQGVSMPITLGNLKNYAKLLTLEDEELRFDMDDIFDLITNNYPREEVDIIKDVWGE